MLCYVAFQHQKQANILSGKHLVGLSNTAYLTLTIKYAIIQIRNIGERDSILLCLLSKPQSTSLICDLDNS